MHIPSYYRNLLASLSNGYHDNMYNLQMLQNLIPIATATLQESFQSE